ncbi:hypothetical protein [Bradyrhizobium iriomotense]|uniref:hypothetical protein n=1 Tax=Bradyrhizobium iriomotense TaxID=441950 RepID=UPI001B8A50BE|nr:hypothetical protein [Bradyrhizobium iriomotense]MBR0780761.1 hypothetical protein [Bradyrhizobium iriomotense]
MTSVSSIKIDREIGLAHFRRNADLDQAGAVALKSGVFFVLAPKSSGSKVLESLDTGGILPAGDLMRSGPLDVQAVRNTVLNLARLVQCMSLSGCSLEWFFREPYAGAAAKDAILHQVGGGSYERMELTANSHLSFIARVIEDHRESWSFFMFCREAKRDEPFKAEDVKFMVVNAYDGESFCCWLDDRSTFAKDVLGYEEQLLTAVS